MRYKSGTCKYPGCGAQTEHIPGGFIHSDTFTVHHEPDYHEPRPSYDNHPLTNRAKRVE